ncbi:hypothetical protein E5288_WYG014221 [Bos mutus]|uniref:Uncharacterized protein n=1 Tax=Bos mutus TaxID=72004 RepID=A0A6B0R9P9_9CETA|nr:hypothetical protein [Bos mutus]
MSVYQEYRERECDSVNTVLTHGGEALNPRDVSRSVTRVYKGPFPVFQALYRRTAILDQGQASVSSSSFSADSQILFSCPPNPQCKTRKSGIGPVVQKLLSRDNSSQDAFDTKGKVSPEETGEDGHGPFGPMDMGFPEKENNT